ncbi:MAG: P-II family nitrogen regulator [Planctomycetaceae bacterium]|nr:MAG: P-II family nitrogen regulator [Planctomycetaceae bacterium]
MNFKLLLTIVETEKSEAVLTAARNHGASGATVLSSARGLSLNRAVGIFGFELFERREVVLVLAEERRVDAVVNAILTTGEIDESLASGIILRLDVEQAWGLAEHVRMLERSQPPDGPASAG